METHTRSVILCEPQCWGFEHASFNAALLCTLLLAFPEATVSFLGERTHLAWVKSILTSFARSGLERITWETLSIPTRDTCGLHRLQLEFSWCSYVLNRLKRDDAQALIISSICGTALFALKFLLRRQDAHQAVIAIPHSELNSIMDNQPRKPWTWLLSLRQTLRLPQPRGLRYIALGEPIRRHVAMVLPRQVWQFSSMDHPCLWHTYRMPLSCHLSARFGYLGSGVKGAEAFYRLASSVCGEWSNAEFHMVGFLNDVARCAKYSRVIRGMSCSPLPIEEYARRASSLTHVVWTADPLHYRLTASASFLDALSFVKPGLYIRNSYIEHYFRRLGDIGYLCDSFDEMRDLLCSIQHHFPSDRYREQCYTILRGRGIFEPGTLAPQLRRIVDECRRDVLHDTADAFHNEYEDDTGRSANQSQ